MTRSMLRDALSALAAVTLASAAAESPASAKGHALKAYQAEVALDAVRGATLKAAKELTTPARNPNGQNWRWFQDYGGGRFSQPSVQKELSLSDAQ